MQLLLKPYMKIKNYRFVKVIDLFYEIIEKYANNEYQNI